MSERSIEGAPRHGRQQRVVADTGRAFELFVESVRDYAIFMLDPGGYIVSWNRGAERIKGYAPEEIIGSHFSRFYSAEDLAAGKPDRELEQAAATGRIEDEGWRLRNDGSRFWANVIITAVRDVDGTLIGFGKVTRDVTELRDRLEENRKLTIDVQRQAHSLEQEVRSRTRALEAANADLQHANAALQTFAHSIAHDLRGPLRTIRGFAEILLEDHAAHLNDEGKDFVQRLARASTRVDSLVQNLLAYARVAHAGPMVAAERVSWDRVIKTAIRDMEAERAACGGEFRIQAPLGDVLGQSETLSIVAHNLLSNALKFVPPGTAPRVEVWSQAHDGRLRLNVRDNGIGVTFADQARVFSPFERLHGTSRYAGTGLGLAIVAEAIRRLSGTFGVESDGSSGSCFWVELAQVP